MEPPLRAPEEGHTTEKWSLLRKHDLAKARARDGLSPGNNKFSAFRLRASAARTQAVLNVVCGIEGVDMQLMPASFKVLQSDFHWALKDLGSLVFYQACLAWGALADRTSRVRLLAIGCAGWGVVSIFLGTATSYWQFALLKVLNGVALASIGPVAQSLIADFFPPTMRGEHFGWLQLFLCAGCILGALVGGSVASVPVTEGVKGWRLAFFSAGVLSLVAAALVMIVAKEPPRNRMASIGDVQFGATEDIKERGGALCGLYRRCHNFCRAAVSNTFLLLLLQGVCGYIPLHAFQFYMLYFQYVGMPDWQASLLTACPLVGGLLGSLFGGWLGDQAERWNAFHGRPLVGQLGTLLALPLIYIGLLGIPRRPEFFGFYAIDMLFLGFAISWCPSGVNRPILSEIVEPDARATVFATQIAFEGSISAMLGSPVIALLAESIFGYRTGALPSHSAADHERNTEALANALLVATAFPWTICFFLYGLIHFTYPKDAIAYEKNRLASSRRRASNASAADAQKAFQPTPSAAPQTEDMGIPVKGRKAA
ncbi:hypothetical protein Esti_005879 [Eimeria stiedai]